MARFSKYSSMDIDGKELGLLIEEAMGVTEKEKEDFTMVPVEVSIVIRPIATGLAVESIGDNKPDEMPEEQKEKPHLKAANE